MASIPSHIEIKLRNAGKHGESVLKMCIREASSKKSTHLTEISVELGEMALALSSALNYAVWDFADKELRPTVATNEFSKIEKRLDFPIFDTQALFAGANKSELFLRWLSTNRPGIHAYLESVQPYHDDVKSLEWLKVLRNRSAHSLPLESQTFTGNDLAYVGGKPKIVGKKVLVPRRDGITFRSYDLPCYVPELRVIATKSKKWVFFLLDNGRAEKLSVMPFVELIQPQVSGIIQGLYELW